MKMLWPEAPTSSPYISPKSKFLCAPSPFAATLCDVLGEQQNSLCVCTGVFESRWASLSGVSVEPARCLIHSKN